MPPPHQISRRIRVAAPLMRKALIRQAAAACFPLLAHQCELKAAQRCRVLSSQAVNRATPACFAPSHPTRHSPAAGSCSTHHAALRRSGCSLRHLTLVVMQCVGLLC